MVQASVDFSIKEIQFSDRSTTFLNLQSVFDDLIASDDLQIEVDQIFEVQTDSMASMLIARTLE